MTAFDGVNLAKRRGMFKDIAGHEDLTEGIIACAMRVHSAWGPGLLESVYKPCFVIELEAEGSRETRTCSHGAANYLFKVNRSAGWSAHELQRSAVEVRDPARRAP